MMVHFSLIRTSAVVIDTIFSDFRQNGHAGGAGSGTLVFRPSSDRRPLVERLHVEGDVLAVGGSGAARVVASRVTRKTATVAPQTTALAAEARPEVVGHETVDNRVDAALNVWQQVDYQLQKKKQHNAFVHTVYIVE